MPDLEDLLFLEIERRISRDKGRIAKPGQTVSLPAQLPAPAARLTRREILDHRIERIGLADDRHFADQLARSGPRRFEGQLDVIARNVARQQQVTFGAVAVENLVLGQLRQITGKLGFCTAGLAAGADRRHPGIKDFEPDDSIFDFLGRDLDRGEIALVAQISGGAVADFANHRHRLVGAGIIGPAWTKLGVGRALQIIELDIAQLDPDIFEFGVGQRAG